MIDYAHICSQVCEVARKTGAFIRREREIFSSDRVEEKSDQNFVSYVDRQAEQLIVSELRQIVPEAEFITEENTI